MGALIKMYSKFWSEILSVTPEIYKILSLGNMTSTYLLEV